MKIPALFAAAALAATALIASTPAYAATHATPSKMDSKTHSLHALAGKKKEPALKQLTKGPLYSSNARKGVRFEASNLKPKARVRLCTVIVTNDVSSYCTKPVRVSASGKAMYKISLSTPGPHAMHIEIMGFDELGYEETIDSFYFARSVPILDDFKGAKLTVSPKALRAKSLRGARHKPIARLNKSNYDAGDYRFTIRKSGSKKVIAKRTIRNDGFLKPAYRITKRVARLMSKKPGKYIITLTPDYARQTKTTFTVKR